MGLDFSPTVHEIRRRRGGWSEDRLLRRMSPPYGPWNTLSNVAYALVGVRVYLTGDASSGLQDGVFMACMFALALGSGAYHAYKTKLANKLDHWGMFAVFGAMGFHAWSTGLDPLAQAIGMSVVGFLIATTALVSKVDTHDIVNLQVGLSLTSCLIAVMVLGGDLTKALASMGLFAMGYVVWHLDKSPDSKSPFGHGIWHAMTAIALGGMYMASR